MGTRIALLANVLLSTTIGCSQAPRPLELIAEATSYGVPSSYAHALYARGVSDPVGTLRYRSLGIDWKAVDRFTDTEKPNALAIFPVADDAENFYTPASRDVITQIASAYDLAVTVAATEQDVLNALARVPTPTLVLIAGHGAKDALALGGENPWYTKRRNDTNYLDLTDEDLFRQFRSMTPDGIIVLLSCSTGAGGRDAKNLANLVKQASQRRVIAAHSDASGMIIEQLVPFRARIYAIGLRHPSNDVTYFP